MKSKIKYPELIALVMLNISIIISWMAYNKYLPVIIEQFGLKSFSNFLIYQMGFALPFYSLLSEDKFH